jgi:hypothetical protein
MKLNRKMNNNEEENKASTMKKNRKWLIIRRGIRSQRRRTIEIWLILRRRGKGRSPTEATRLRFDQEKSRLHFNSYRVVIASWSRWWEKRHYELKVRPVGYCKVIYSWSNSSRVASVEDRPYTKVYWEKVVIIGQWMSILCCRLLTVEFHSC